jgi:hypothetical protein
MSFSHLLIISLMKKHLSFVIFSALFSVLMPQISLAFCTDSVPLQFKEAAQNLFDSKVLRGNPDGSCKLGTGLNRAEFATFVLRNNYSDQQITELAASEQGGFPDLQMGIWYEQIAKAAKKQGLIKGDDGTGRGRFGDGVNAAEAVTITLRGAGMAIPAAKAGETWYDTAFNLAKAGGITTLSPTYKMTRGDAVLLIHQVNQGKKAISAAILPTGSTSTSKESGITKLLNIKIAADYEAAFAALSSNEVHAYEGLSPTLNIYLSSLVCAQDATHKTANRLTLGYQIDCATLTQKLQASAQDPAVSAGFDQLVQNELLLLVIHDACSTKNYISDLNEQICAGFLDQTNPAIKSYADMKSAALANPKPANTSFSIGSSVDSASADALLSQIIDSGNASRRESIIRSSVDGCFLGESGCN